MTTAGVAAARWRRPSRRSLRRRRRCRRRTAPPESIHDDRIAEDAYAVDLDFDDVAVAQEDLRPAGHADTRRRAGSDDVARLQGHEARRVADEVGYAEHHLRR